MVDFLPCDTPSISKCSATNLKGAHWALIPSILFEFHMYVEICICPASHGFLWTRLSLLILKVCSNSRSVRHICTLPAAPCFHKQYRTCLFFGGVGLTVLVAYPTFCCALLTSASSSARFRLSYILGVLLSHPWISVFSWICFHMTA